MSKQIALAVTAVAVTAAVAVAVKRRIEKKRQLVSRHEATISYLNWKRKLYRDNTKYLHWKTSLIKSLHES